MAEASKTHSWRAAIPYGRDNFLQTYNVYQRDKSSSTQQCWIVYIHGGYFRDPKITADCFEATVQQLETGNLPLLPIIAGFATLNYRLSKHPDQPQPEGTPSFDLRNAHWPEHLDDVLAGLRQLQDEHQFGRNYILVGHSVGAELALLASLKARNSGFPAPRVVVGLSGIYDFPLIHTDLPDYKAVTYGGMEPSEEIAASPASYAVQEYEDAGVQKVVLGHSRDDGLVPWNQVVRMRDVLGRASAGAGYVQTLELFGGHDDIYRDGKESARAILLALEVCSGLLQ